MPRQKAKDQDGRALRSWRTGWKLTEDARQVFSAAFGAALAEHRGLSQSEFAEELLLDALARKRKAA